MAVQIRFIAETLAAPEYNCSAHSPEEWTEIHGVRQPLLGWWSIIFATTCQILYVPALRVFYRERALTCYKIMLFLALADFMSIFGVGSMFGYTMIRGLVYCSDQRLSWIMGAGICCGWYVSTGTCALLVLNRISELANRASFFQGWRSSLAMLIILAYGVMVTLFTRLVSPNSAHQTLAFETFIPGHSLDEYPNRVNMLHNISVAIVIPTLYIFLCLILWWKSSRIQPSTTTQILQSKVFTQASIICFFNATTAAAWIVQMFIPTPQIIITAGMITIQSVHGLPSVIYVSLNRIVRQEFWKLLGKKPKDTLTVSTFISTNNRNM